MSPLSALFGTTGPKKDQCSFVHCMAYTLLVNVPAQYTNLTLSHAK